MLSRSEGSKCMKEVGYKMWFENLEINILVKIFFRGKEDFKCS